MPTSSTPPPVALDTPAATAELRRILALYDQRDTVAKTWPTSRRFIQELEQHANEVHGRQIIPRLSTWAEIERQLDEQQADQMDEDREVIKAYVEKVVPDAPAVPKQLSAAVPEETPDAAPPEVAKIVDPEPTATKAGLPKRPRRSTTKTTPTPKKGVADGTDSAGRPTVASDDAGAEPGPVSEGAGSPDDHGDGDGTG